MDFLFCQKTHDVACDRDLLRTLKADTLLRLRQVNILEYLTTDIELLRRRSRMFADTGRIAGLKELLDTMIVQLGFIADMVKLQSAAADNERALYSVKQLEQYFEFVDAADAFYTAHAHEFTAEDYAALFGRIHALASSDEYGKLRRGTAQMLREISRVKSITVGFNFDASLSPSEAGILSVNDYCIESGLLIDRLLRMDTREAGQSIAPLVVPRRQCKEDEYGVLTYSMYAALNKIFRRQIRQWEPEITAYIGEHLAFLLDILPDLRFIAEIASIQETMRAAGLTLCPPEFHPKEERVLRGRNVYNPILALSLREQEKGDAVASDVCFDEAGSVFLLTGPNNGGKSEYLTALCLCTVMAQLGMMVPAQSFALSPADAILLHVPKVTALNEKGRLAEECASVASMFRRAGAHSLLLFDEAFSSTDVTEAVELSLHVLRALLYKGTRCVFSTHFHQLAHYADELNSAADARGRMDFLVAGTEGQAKRTYKILRRAPEGKSYAQSIADVYGIRYEKLIAPDDL